MKGLFYLYLLMVLSISAGWFSMHPIAKASWEPMIHEQQPLPTQKATIHIYTPPWVGAPGRREGAGTR